MTDIQMGHCSFSPDYRSEPITTKIVIENPELVTLREQIRGHEAVLGLIKAMVRDAQDHIYVMEEAHLTPEAMKTFNEGAAIANNILERICSTMLADIKVAEKKEVT